MVEMWAYLVSSSFFTLGVIPLLIFLCRVADVSLGTLRVAFIARGNLYLAPLIGFFEILIWLVAITQIMSNLTHVVYYFAYAGGFTAGTFIGLLIERKIALGMVAIRIIVREDAFDLIQSMKENKYGLTYMKGEGVTGPVHILFSLVKRAEASKVIELVEKFHPQAFYSLEDVRYARDPMPLPTETKAPSWARSLRTAKRK
ncbi:MAG TPA: DUF2179 domain-containing protein [Acidobacteriota bacterium]|nr:DUF2179 domain-containing protein [Acidobacteriota bacterium]